MIVISFRFTAGRYHATPWGHHVNEGIPEWPPSPWRILRSLVATWKRTLPDIDEAVMKEILSSLVTPPKFHLPPATLGHTRHYMPWGKEWREKRHDSKTLVFDAFVIVPKNRPMFVYWPDAEISPEGRDALGRILKNIPYLGRSESWCEAKLEENLPPEENGFMAVPWQEGDYDEDKFEIVEILCADPSIDFTRPLDERHPLLVRTSALREEGLLNPPQSRWVQYLRHRKCFEVVRAVTEKPERSSVKVIRYILDSPVLPRIINTLHVGDAARSAAMSVYGGAERRKSPILSGKDDGGKPLKGHRHAFYLATDEDGDGRLDHLTIYAEGGLDTEHQEALARLSKLLNRSLAYPVDLILLGMVEEPTDVNLQGTLLFGPSRAWQSATPFLLSRHPKVKRDGRWVLEPIPDGVMIEAPTYLGRYPTEEHLMLAYGVLREERMMQKDGPLSQLLLEIERRGLPYPEIIQPLPDLRWGPSTFSFPKKGRGKAGTVHWIEFKRYRKKGNPPAMGIPYGFRIVFPVEITGPLALGHDCHFGMGLFLSSL